jgi:hypothetical protein
MKNLSLVASGALGAVLGAALFNTPHAYGQLATIDVKSIAQEIKSVAAETGILDVITAMQTVQKAINDTMSDINSAIGNNTYGDTNTLLRQGFTQTSNYAKAQISALQQIFDASNTANARVSRDLRNAQIRDEHTASPAHCAAIDGGVSTQSASIQAFGVAQTIAAIHDARGAAGPGMPSHFGQAQGVASMSAEHLGLYCNADDAAANLCTLSATPDADQQASNFLGSGAYVDQNAVNTAKDVAINLIEPVAPAALRGDQLASINGQDAAVRRHSYNTRMSLAQTFVDNAIGMQVPAIPLSASQTQYMQSMGLPVPTSGNGSWLQVLQIEAERRVSDVGWHTALQSMPPAAVEREMALELALNNYLLFQTYKMNLQHAAISATQLAEDTERNFLPTAKMPTPSIVSNANGGT